MKFFDRDWNCIFRWLPVWEKLLRFWEAPDGGQFRQPHAIGECW